MLQFLYSFYGKAPPRIRKFIVAISEPARLLFGVFLRKLRLRGYIQFLDPRDNGALTCYSQKENYERPQLELLLSYLSCNIGATVLDIGANYGQYSLAVADIGRYGLVHHIVAFEPDSIPYECLSKSITANGFESFFYPLQVIVGESAGFGALMKSVSSSLSNRTFIEQSNSLIFKDIERCRISSVDEEMLRLGLLVGKDPIFIKMDVEGAEPKVMRGARKFLAGANRFYIQFEYYPFAMEEADEDTRLFKSLIMGLPFDTVLKFDDDEIVSISRSEFEAHLENLNSNAALRRAENFVIVKNCTHPERITALLRNRRTAG